MIKKYKTFIIRYLHKNLWIQYKNTNSNMIKKNHKKLGDELHSSIKIAKDFFEKNNLIN